MSAAALHPQNVVALIWDFDKTLIPSNMQDPIFEEYGVDSRTFWREVDDLTALLRRAASTSPDTSYLNHLLTYVKEGRMAGLNNAKLKELGGRIQFHHGVPGIFDLVPRRRARRGSHRALHRLDGPPGDDRRQHRPPVRRGRLGVGVHRDGAEAGYDRAAPLPTESRSARSRSPTTTRRRPRALFEINKGSVHKPPSR